MKKKTAIESFYPFWPSLFYFTHDIEKKSKEEGFSPPWKKKFLRYLFGGEILKRCSFSFQKLHMFQLKSQVFLEWKATLLQRVFLPQLKRSCFFLKTSICHRDFIYVMLTPLRPHWSHMFWGLKVWEELGFLY